MYSHLTTSTSPDGFNPSTFYVAQQPSYYSEQASAHPYPSAPISSFYDDQAPAHSYFSAPVSSYYLDQAPLHPQLPASAPSYPVHQAAIPPYPSAPMPSYHADQASALPHYSAPVSSYYLDQAPLHPQLPASAPSYPVHRAPIPSYPSAPVPSYYADQASAPPHYSAPVSSYYLDHVPLHAQLPASAPSHNFPSTLAPPQDSLATTAPPQDSPATTAPPRDSLATTAPLQDSLTATASPQDSSSTTAPYTPAPHNSVSMPVTPASPSADVFEREQSTRLQRFIGEMQAHNMHTASPWFGGTRARRSTAAYNAGRKADNEVVGNEFQTDPCALDHECTPGKYAEERGNRAVYNELQHVRRDSKYAGKKPVQIYFDLVARHHEADSVEMEDAIRAAIRRSGSRAKTSNCAQCWKMAESHSYYGKCTARISHSPGWLPFPAISPAGMACENGLYAIVADGTHSLHPKCLGCHAQLYSIHGVCSQDLDIPLMFCITEKKTRAVYRKIFEELKTILKGETPRRVVLDFEKSAIYAARMVFPTSSIEGCAFHLAQAWNRKRDSLALRKHLQGQERDARVVAWWETIKGVVFLPQDLLPEVQALRSSPVPQEHAAHRKCQEFLSYLDTNWMRGPFKDLWCKWGLEELRTTNLAEAFHRRIQVLAVVDHPPLSVLIDVLKMLNYEARAALTRLREDPEHARASRRDHLERKIKVSEEMARFREIYQEGATRDEIESYCRRMSRYITNKTI